MRLLRNHPMLRNCRFLWFAGGTAQARNRLGPGANGTVTNAGQGKSGRFNALTWGGSASDGIAWANTAGYGPRANGPMTVIARVRVAGDNGTTGQIQGIVAAKDAGGADSTGGFAMYWLKDTFTNPGFNFTLYTSGGFYYAFATGTGGSGGYGVDRVVAGVYDKKPNGPRIWIDGVENTSLGNSGVGSPTTVAWNPALAANLHFGDLGGTDSNPLNGALAWVAIFDKALTEREIKLWSRDGAPWPFEQEDSQLSLLTTVNYVNTVGARSVYTPSGAGAALIYRSRVDAFAYVGGDLVSVPGSGGSVTYRNAVGVGQRYVGSEPELAFYRNAVAVGSVVTTRAPVKYRNVVSVGQVETGRIDGRIDLIGTARYRR